MNENADNLDRIVKALEKLPDSYETEHTLKQNGYVEGVCDSINLVVKLFIHGVTQRSEPLKAVDRLKEITQKGHDEWDVTEIVRLVQSL